MSAATVRYRFGEFCLTTPHLTLLCRDQPVKLGSRALNLLMVLVKARGGLVSRQDLLQQVWPDQAIDESAIRVHFSAARKVLVAGGLDSQAIVNEAGRGYRLAVEVRLEGANPEIEPSRSPARPPSLLPRRLASVIGRDKIIDALAQEVSLRRFVTIAGPGGIGKTTVAVRIAEKLADADMPTHFIDLSPLSAEASIADALATFLGLPVVSDHGLDRIVQALANSPVLLVFDNCEHVIDTAAELAEELLQRLPDLLLLTTSREPLRAEGEWVHRLAALSLPPHAHSADAEEYSAVALFIQRARAVHDALVLDPAALGAIVDICRRLDGIPLAIELAAARSDMMTPAMIAEGLEDCFNLLVRGRRTALPRHQTLRAALDWSYALLDETSKTALARLAMFRSSFDRDAAMALGREPHLSATALMNVLSDLVAKSLVMIVPSADGALRYRLLDTTRHYGLERLEERGELQQARHDHAAWLLRLCAGSAAAWEGKAPREWLADYSRWINDIRSALAWTNATGGGDTALGVSLLIASAPLWFHLSLPGEFLDLAEAAIAAAGRVQIDPALEVELHSAYGHALWHIRGPVEAMGTAFERALALAMDLGSEGLVLRALWGVWAHSILAGNYRESLALAQDFMARAEIEKIVANRLTGWHMVALSRHFCGDHEGARQALNEVIAGDAAPERANHANHAQVDGKIAVMSLLMRLDWQDGNLPAAMSLAHDCVQDIMRVDHALSACYGLAIGCIPVALAAGETQLAQQWLETLESHTERHGLEHWQAFVSGYRGAMTSNAPLPKGISAMQREMFLVAAGDLAAAQWAQA